MPTPSPFIGSIKRHGAQVLGNEMPEVPVIGKQAVNAMNFMVQKHRIIRWLFQWLGVCLFCGSVACAAEVKVQAQLVWGTDTAKADSKDLVELDATIRERLRRPLRWKHYFVMRSLSEEIPEKETKHFVLSKRCSIEVRKATEKELEFKIYSLKEGEEPKLVKTDRIPIEQWNSGHILVFGGDSKDNWDDAWFVILTSEPPAEKPAEPKS